MLNQHSPDTSVPHNGLDYRESDAKTIKLQETIATYRDELKDWVKWIEPQIGSQRTDYLKSKLASANSRDDREVVRSVRENLTFDVLAKGIPETYHLPTIPGREDYLTPDGRIDKRHGATSAVYQVILPEELTRTVISGDGTKSTLTRLTEKVVAVKKFNRTGLSEIDVCLRILRETRIASQVEHEYTASCLAIMVFNDDDGNVTDIALLFKFFPQTLQAFSFGSKGRERIRCLHMLRDVASALSHLHSVGIIHGDLRGINVFTDGAHAYVGDFGGSKDALIGFTTDVRSNIRWIAQERLANSESSRPTKESDIYEFGSTFLEIMSGDVPYKNVSSEHELMREWTKKERAKPYEERLPQKPTDFMEPFWEFCLECWSQDPQGRPSPVRLIEMLDELLGWLRDGRPKGPRPSFKKPTPGPSQSEGREGSLKLGGLVGRLTTLFGK